MARSKEDARYLEEAQALYLELRGGGFTLSPVDSDRIRSWRDRGLPLELALQALRGAHASWLGSGRAAKARPFSLQSVEPFAEELLQVAARRLVGSKGAASGDRGLAADASTDGTGAGPAEPDSTVDSPGPLQGMLRPVLEELQQRHEAQGSGSALASRGKKCPRCSGSGYVLGREGPIAVAALCGCERSCTSCNGVGLQIEKVDGYEFSRPCKCQTLSHRVSAFNRAQLPSRFTEAKRGAGAGVRELKGFERFHAEPSDPPELGQMKHLMQAFARTAKPGSTPKGYGIFGKPGTGKTHLLVAALAHMTLERGIDCRYIEISFLFADLKAAISDPRARTTVDKIDALSEVDVLAIDELGKGRGSVFEEEVLDELIGRRYNNGKLTLFATNFGLEVAERQAGRERGAAKPELASQSLRLRVGERVFSRLHEMVDFIDLPPTVRDKRIP